MNNIIPLDGVNKTKFEITFESYIPFENFYKCHNVRKRLETKYSTIKRHQFLREATRDVIWKAGWSTVPCYRLNTKKGHLVMFYKSSPLLNLG